MNGAISSARMRGSAGPLLRPLRLVRLATELDLQPDPDSERLTREAAPRVADAAAERVWAELRRLEAAGEQASHPPVGEELHTAVRVVNDEPLAGTEQLVGDDERSDGVVAGSASGIAN